MKLAHTPILILVLMYLAGTLQAAPTLKTTSWQNNDRDFQKFTTFLSEQSLANLAARPEARLFGLSRDIVKQLADGDSGVRGGHGRIPLGKNTTPSVITVYLGKITPIHAVGFYTFNIDQRANQIYEVRFALKETSPTKLPEFPKEPHLTTGSKVIGPNSGGFHSRFTNKDGSPLVQKANWVQFTVWPTYKFIAGTPLENRGNADWCAGIELEVLGAPNDVIQLSEEVRKRRELLQKLPKDPPFDKLPTWEETLRKNRENIIAWEKTMDDVLALEHGFEFSPWQIAGPFPQNTKAPPQNASWKPFPELKDGHTLDLAKHCGAKPGDAIFIRRNGTFSKYFPSGNPLRLNIAFMQGTATLETGNGHTPAGDLAIRPWHANVQKGDRALTVKAITQPDGTCFFYFQPQATGRSRINAGGSKERIERRRRIFDTVARNFPDPLSRLMMVWEDQDRIWLNARDGYMAAVHWFEDEWAPNTPNLWLASRYRSAIPQRIANLKEALQLHDETTAIQTHDYLRKLEETLNTPNLKLDERQDQERYRSLMANTAILNIIHDIQSAKLAIEDQIKTFPETYAQKGNAFLPVIQQQLATAHAIRIRTLQQGERMLPEIVGFKQQKDAAINPILLQNPLLNFDKLLFAKGGFWFASNWGGPNNLGNEFAVLSPVRPDGKITTLAKPGRISDFELDFDAKHILYSNGKHVFEMNADGSNVRQITKIENPHVKHFDACYLPSGDVIFSSTACEQAVPCTGAWYVANLHRADRNGENERRLCFDQDHDWNPTVLNNGRVIFTRWEYTDTPHYFSRLLFHMNPDGTGQMEYYGSNSYWPNSMFWPRPIPGHPTAISCTVTGHHGTFRQGELYVIDPALARNDAHGVIQQIPGRGKKVQPKIVDNLIDKSWPKFASPFPLAEPETNRGAGRYFLATMKPDRLSPWGIYLVDTFDNLTPILIGNYINAMPLRPRFKPPVITPKVNLTKDHGYAYIADVYKGPGIKGFPKGTVKRIRIGSHHYRYGNNGDTYASSMDGGWDVKRILGTVPVEPDGSAFFQVPANTPIFVQPLDQDGKALQTMRSWFVAMPSETAGCVGCHEPQNSVSPAAPGTAARKPPHPITPWLGKARGFGFDQDVQPVLDRRCVGCHDGSISTRPDFRAKSLRPDYKGRYSPAYLALHPYVRRAGIEADYVMQKPAEWNADTSHLIQMLIKGHHNVTLDKEEWERLFTWIDFNVPYAPNWRQSHQKPSDEQVQRRAHFKKILASLDDKDEELLPAPPPLPFIKPLPKPPLAPVAKPDNWPLSQEDAVKAQKALNQEPLVLKLSDSVTMTFMPIPPGKALLGDANGTDDEQKNLHVFTNPAPFWLAQCEVSNEQFALFDPEHDSAYMDARNKDRITRGYPVNHPKQPVIRITHAQAVAFCEWLSKKTGRTCTLPTEDEWEYACRAGTDTPWNFGTLEDARKKPVANVSDSSLKRWNWGRIELNYTDGHMFSAHIETFPKNRWGLLNMHGNVAEWTASSYTPDEPNLAVVKGGSWNDLFKYARSASRWRYPKWQPVYNVGFRVKIQW